MTVPGGVPNLPTGALTIDTLPAKTQDMSQPAMRARAAERFPNIFDSSSGGNPLNDLTPLGILTQLFAGFNSSVANADPADIEGPEDLPDLLLQFIESLPVIGELVGLLEAILGTYDGDDEVLLQVQAIFAPIRKLLELVTGISGIPGVGDVTSGWNGLGIGQLADLLSALGDIDITNPGAIPAAIAAAVAAAIHDIVDAFIPGGGSGGLGALASYFGGLVSLPDLVESLTGNPGTLPDLNTWSTQIPSLTGIVAALTGGGGGLGSLTTWAQGLASLASLNQLKDVLGGEFGSGIEAIIERFGGMIRQGDDIQGDNIVGEIDDVVLAPLHFLRDTIKKALTGVNASGTSAAEVENVLAAQNAALVGAQSQLARYEGIFTSGVAVADLYEFTTSSGAGPNFQVYYSGSTAGNVYVDGHNLAWNSPALNANTRTARMRWLGNAEKPATSSTNLQYVEMVLNSIPQAPPLGFGSDAWNGLLMRCNDSMTNFMELRFIASKVLALYRFLGGAGVQLTTWSMPFDYAVGTRLGCKIGKPGTSRFFQPVINGFPLENPFTESGTASMDDASHRGWGISMFAGAKTDLILIPAQTKPGSIKQWTAQDQVTA